MRPRSVLSRRLFLTRAASVTLTLGSAPLARRVAALPDPYLGGLWLAGDHHIHTKYSVDGLYEIEQQVASAVEQGLGFCVITDHGGEHHDRVALQQAYPELLAARRRYPQILIFQGLEWNIPAAEHGSVILPPTADEAERVAAFEARFDEKNTTKAAAAARSEEDAVAGVRYLQSLLPRPLFIANHPARRGLDSPHELRAWADAGPDVMRGCEGAPGHGASTLVGILRGNYDDRPRQGSWPGYPLESYRTWGGYDYYVAQVGGLWDSLLGEGRPFYITANSDNHRHYGDHTPVDRTTYKTVGHVTAPSAAPTAHATHDQDFPPGAYHKTWVYVPRRDPLLLLEAMRAGNMFTTMGGLIESLELWVHDGRQAAPMGSTLLLARRGDDVEVVLRLRLAQRRNRGGYLPVLHHIDVITGQIHGPLAHRDATTNPTARVVAQLRLHDGQRSGDTVQFRQPIRRVESSFYVRVRGTNTDVRAPLLDPPKIDPWTDLWFYSNPVLVRVP